MDDQGKPVELNGSFGISKVNPNGKSIKVHGVKVRRNEILKIKYSLRLKDEWNDGNKYPVSSNTNIITTKKFNLASGLNGNKIEIYLRFGKIHLQEDLLSNRIGLKMVGICIIQELK